MSSSSKSPSSQEATALALTALNRAGTPVWKHLLWAGVGIMGIWALTQIPSTMIVFSLAWLMAYLLNPAVDALVARRLGPIRSCSRGVAVGLVAGLLLALLGGAMALMLPQLSDQIERLVSLQQSLGNPADLPILLREKAEPFLARVPEQYREQVMASASNILQQSASKIGLWASEIVKSIGAFLGQLLSAIFLVGSAFLVSLYILMNWHGLLDSFLEKLPRQYQREVLSLSVKLNVIFGGYLKATILTGIACMIATFLSLVLLTAFSGHSFPYKGLVAFVAGITYPVPVIGIIATSILGGVLGFVSDGSFGFGMAVLVVINVINVLIDRTVQPRLMSDAIGVSELFVMFAAFAGGEVAGVWGMLLGIPVAAMGKTLFEWFHVNFLVVDEEIGKREDEGESSSPAALKTIPHSQSSRVVPDASPQKAVSSLGSPVAREKSKDLVNQKGEPQELREQQKASSDGPKVDSERLAQIAEQLGGTSEDMRKTVAVPPLAPAPVKATPEPASPGSTSVKAPHQALSKPQGDISLAAKPIPSQSSAKTSGLSKPQLSTPPAKNVPPAPKSKP